MPKVSIVLPTYNGEKYIRESIDSILKQTFFDWELIIVNDCSNDATSQIIAEYKKKDSRIKIIHNEVNKKLPNSLNIGFREAIGEYLTWTSDDNIYLPEALDEMVNYLDKSNVMMVCAGMRAINANGEVIFDWVPYREEKMYYNDAVGACFMYRRGVLKEIGEYDASMFLVEDYDYWLRVLFKYGKIGYIENKLYLYRIHENSLTGTKKRKIHLQLLKLRKRYISEIIKFYSETPDALTSIFADFLVNDIELDKDLYEMFFEKVPELKMISKYSGENQIIAYGSGKIGDAAYCRLGNKIELYVDLCADQYCFKKNGVKVIFPDKISEYILNRKILLTVAEEKTYSILLILKKLGINKCLVENWNDFVIEEYI